MSELNYNKDMQPGNSVMTDEMIRSMMRREGDNLERNFLRYREVVRDVFNDLNLKSIKWTERRFIPIDKRTNSIILPCNALRIASFTVVNAAGKLETLILNKNLSDDIIDGTLAKNCECECGECSGDLCGLIKNYEAITEEVTEDMPNESTKVFTKITRKILYPDGSVIMKYTEPVRVYENDAWIDTIDSETEEVICKLDVKKCGCISDTEENRKKLAACCDGVDLQTDFGCTTISKCGHGCAPTDNKIYNYTELGNRVTFPSDFCYDKVLVRYYVNATVKQIRIPVLARPTFLAGLKHFAFEYDDRVPKSVKDGYEAKYDKRKDDLAIDMHKLSLKEFCNAVIPPNRKMV